MRSNLHPKKRVVLYEGQLTVVRQAGSEVRHCILSKDAFEYYAIDDIDGPLGKPLARFPMISSSCMEWIPSGLKLRHGARVLTLRGADDTIAEWRKALQHALSLSQTASLQLRVFGFREQLCHVLAETSWRVRDVKAVIKSICGVLPSEQRLIYEMDLLEDPVLLTEVLPLEARRLHDIAMVRCPPAVQISGGAVMERHEALKAVRHDWRHLGEMQEIYRQDREIVMAAVAQDCMALQFASDDLRADREVISAAVHQSGSALQFVDEALREEVLSSAVGY